MYKQISCFCLALTGLLATGRAHNGGPGSTGQPGPGCNRALWQHAAKNMSPLFTNLCTQDVVITSPLQMFAPVVRVNSAVTSGTVVLQNGYISEMSARTYFRLLPGFSAAGGSQMRLYIDASPCPPVTPPQPAVAEAVTASALVVYPNPNNGRFTVQLPHTPSNIQLLAMNGHIVYSRPNYTGTVLQLHVPHLAKGAYLLRVVQVKTGQAEYKKLVIQ
jgi:Secretion system C-terminal sorting domain